MKQTLESVVCAGCTCLCDDIEVNIEGTQIVETKNACPTGEIWLRQTPVKPAFTINGKPVDFDVAVQETAKFIRQSRSPLVCGLDGLSTQAQIAAVELGKHVRATIDTTCTNRRRGGTLTMQSVGKVTATLGEVASRADVILFWFCDPVVTHPRFLERFCGDNGQIVVIDEAETETANRATQFISLPRDEIYQLISELRLAHQSETVASGPARSINSILKNARYVASVYGSLDNDQNQHQNLQALYLLTRQLNQQMRAVSIGLRDDANALSAENVLAWNTGFPFGVNFARGVAEYNGLEFSGQAVLERGECDLTLLCSTESIGALNDVAVTHLKQIPQIVIDNGAQALEFQPTIKFEVGFDRGDWCRMDDVTLPVAGLPLGSSEPNWTERALIAVLNELK